MLIAAESMSFMVIFMCSYAVFILFNFDKNSFEYSVLDSSRILIVCYLHINLINPKIYGYFKCMNKLYEFESKFGKFSFFDLAIFIMSFIALLFVINRAEPAFDYDRFRLYSLFSLCIVGVLHHFFIVRPRQKLRRHNAEIAGKTPD